MFPISGEEGETGRIGSRNVPYFHRGADKPGKWGQIGKTSVPYSAVCKVSSENREHSCSLFEPDRYIPSAGSSNTGANTPSSTICSLLESCLRSSEEVPPALEAYKDGCAL